jgi:hypothetical protein
MLLLILSLLLICQSKKLSITENLENVPKIYTDMQMGRMKGFENWCSVHLDQNQAGWSVFQPYREWVNVTLFVITEKSELGMIEAIQITAAKNESNVDVGGYVIHSKLEKSSLLLSINYFVTRFKFYIGYKGNMTAFLCLIPSIKFGTHV